MKSIDTGSDSGDQSMVLCRVSAGEWGVDPRLHGENEFFFNFSCLFNRRCFLVRAVIPYLVIHTPAIAVAINPASMSSHGQGRLKTSCGRRMPASVRTVILGWYSLPILSLVSSMRNRSCVAAWLKALGRDGASGRRTTAFPLCRCTRAPSRARSPSWSSSTTAG